jgi:plastocyanin
MSATALKIGTFLLAASGEPSKTPFYIAAGLLIGWAVLVAFLGLSRADFPGTTGRARGVMAISAILVLGATSMAVATSAKKKHAAAGQGAVTATGAAAAGTSTTLSLTADPTNQLKYDKTSLTAKAGTVKIEFTNQSQTMHNVTIEANGTKVAASPTIIGSSTTLSASLKPGTYTFYCSVDSHRMLGMKGTLTVQ